VTHIPINISLEVECYNDTLFTNHRDEVVEEFEEQYMPSFVSDDAL